MAKIQEKKYEGKLVSELESISNVETKWQCVPCGKGMKWYKTDDESGVRVQLPKSGRPTWLSNDQVYHAANSDHMYILDVSIEYSTIERDVELTVLLMSEGDQIVLEEIPIPMIKDFIDAEIERIKMMIDMPSSSRLPFSALFDYRFNIGVI